MARNGHGATCGDVGGMSLTGQPCAYKPGWGTDHPGEGPCKRHDASAAAKQQGLKTRYLELLSPGDKSQRAVCREMGVGAPQVWRWRQADPVFDKAAEEAQGESDAHRVKMVEDSLFARIVDGKASPAETIFFLVNRGKGRWRHIQTIQHTGPQGESLIPLSAIRAAMHEAGDE